MNTTTDPGLESFVEVEPDSHFPIQNLPYGVFDRSDNPGTPRVGVRIGDLVLDLRVASEAGLFDGVNALTPAVLRAETLNPLMALGRPAWRGLRERVSELLRAENPELRDSGELLGRVLVPVDRVTMRLPAAIGDYTDFYSSREHATNVGTMFRGPDNALMPNWLHLPVAYHGRSSSIVPSGTEIRRPRGQIRPDDSKPPIHGPSRLMDFELEMAFFVGPGNELGAPIPVGSAGEHIFGMVLVNDWSARDVQKWEYQPLGPFDSKNFATAISPWVVTIDALEPFRCKGPEQDPAPLEYLRASGDWAFDIRLEIWLAGERSKEPTRISVSNYRHLYWNACQQLAHHTVTGCNARPGDMMASGTISAPDPGGYGSMLELSWRGERPIELAGGETRKFIEDGDTVTITGFCQGPGFRVGFGEVTNKLLPVRG